jgi:tetratricopeptide (TPR) repeat protein
LAEAAARPRAEAPALDRVTDGGSALPSKTVKSADLTLASPPLPEKPTTVNPPGAAAEHPAADSLPALAALPAAAKSPVRPSGPARALAAPSAAAPPSRAVARGQAPVPAAGSSTAPAETRVLDFPRQLADCRGFVSRSRFREAAGACAAAAQANPGSAEALTLLAHVELNRGRMARASALAQKAVAIDPDQADAYVIIGGVDQDSGRNHEAKAAYTRYLQLAPQGRYAGELRSILGSL